MMAGFLFLASLGTGCAGIPPTQDPIKTLFYTEENKGNRTLIVFLPGIHEEPAVLAKRGLVQAVRNRRLAIDMVGVGAHLGYYAEREFLDNLEQPRFRCCSAKINRACFSWRDETSARTLGLLSFALR